MDVLYSVNSKEFCLRNDTELMQELSWITTGALMEVFLSPQHHKSLPNVPTATLGGKQLWDSLWEVDGWQVQKCRVLGGLMPHYRILDPKGVRRAWYLSRKDLTRDARLFANMIRQKLVTTDFRYGIVFSGGGGKGAYQIGVWKYLHELGIDQKIHGVSGASVGALNSLLFLQGDYQKAEHVWANIRQEDFTYRAEEQEKQQAKFSQLLCSELMDLLTGGSSFVCHVPTYADAIKTLIKQLQSPSETCDDFIDFCSLFSQQRLREIIQDNVDPTAALSNASDKIVYSMACKIPRIAYPCCWSNRPFAEIQELVLASAAMPFVYPFHVFDGRLCIDGGFVDNIPVSPLVKDFHHIIVIHLQPDCADEQKEWRRSTRGLSLDQVTFYHVYPSKADHMESHTDTMTVNPELTQYRMALGYHDAKEQLQPLVEHEKSRMPVPNEAQAEAVLPAVQAIW